jgi:hypothetical protein
MHVLPRAVLLLFLTAAGAKAQVRTGGAAPDGAAGADSGAAAAPPFSSAPAARVGSARVIPGSSPDCHTAPITYIFVDNHSIFDASDPLLPRRFDWAYLVVNRLHVRTRPGVIRRELLFHTGDCLDPALLDESARLLRGFPFISRADVYPVRQPDSTYHVVVDTQDEWTTGVGVRLGIHHGLELRGARARDRNLFGSGQTGEVWYIEHDLTRDYGVAWNDPQLGGSRWDMAGALGRTRAGVVAWQTLEYPFLGETGRWAGRESARHTEQDFDFVAGNDPQELDVLVPVRDVGADVAVVGRLGRPGDLTIFGGGLAFRNRSFHSAPLSVVDQDFATLQPADSAQAAQVRPEMEPRDAVRAVLLLGQRNIYWTQRRGYDSPRGQQDIRLGAEVSLALSRSLPSLARDDDLATTLTLYTGFDAGPALVVLRARGDGLRDFAAPAGAPEWKDLFADSELLAYLRGKLLPAQTLVLRAGGTGGWRARSPFQLTLAGDDAVRGYDSHRFPGGRRASFTAEDRIFFGWPFPEVFDLGGTVFADGGRIWPGDAPFGTDSGWRASAGVGLRAAFPAGGRITYRADVAVPLDGGLRNARVLFSVGEIVGLARQRVRQLDRSRPPGLSGDLFSFPR